MEKFIPITDIYAKEILDSRGNPTIEVVVCTEYGTGTAAVPSGASTGIWEAHELRDDEDRYNGKGVLKAVGNVNGVIYDELVGENVLAQRHIDKRLISIDGTENKSKLGANAILGVSLAVAKCAADSLGMPLYRYIGGANGHVMPIPMMNILNGGAHSNNNLDIQEFMIMPVGALTFQDGLRKSAEVFHALKSLLNSDGLTTAVGDEGGFAPNLENDEEAIKYIIKAVEKAGYNVDSDFKIALDAASSEWVNENGEYFLPKRLKSMTKAELVEYWADLCDKYPICSIEDGMGEDDIDGWKMLTDRLGSKIQLVGDDLFVTNTERLKKGISENMANAILIKPNQIGTLTETLDAIETAKQNKYNTIISHRSGETPDTTISDIAVAVNAGQIKTGAPSRGERVAKYNRLLWIEAEV